MRSAFLLVLMVWSTSARSSNTMLSLDFIGEGKDFALTLAEDAPKDSKTLELFHGRKKQWCVVEGAKNVASIPDNGVNQFKGFTIISETSPTGAILDPSKRIYNLPELIDRLLLERKISANLEVMAETQGVTTILVKKPTVIAASYSLGRKIKILNRSKLILIIGFPELIEILQDNILDQNTDVYSNIYSTKCIPVTAKGGTGMKRFTFDGYYLGSVEENIGCENHQLRSFNLKMERWMPQLVLSSKIRKESMLRIGIKWESFFNLGL